MPLYATAQPFTLSTTVTNVSTGLLADPGALLLTYVNVVAGSTPVVKNWPTPAEIVKDNVGSFHYDAAAVGTAGHYRVTWVSTGANAGEKYDVFDAFDPAAYPRLVSFADAKTFLRLIGTADDPLLDRMIGWASARIQMEVVGYQQTFTDTVRARGGSLHLPHTPVQTVTAISQLDQFGTGAIASDLYAAVPSQGLVKSASGQWITGVYAVIYTAGPAQLTPGVDGACLALIQHWWNQSQAHGSATYGDQGFIPDFKGLPYTVTNKLAVAARPVLLA